MRVTAFSALGYRSAGIVRWCDLAVPGQVSTVASVGHMLAFSQIARSTVPHIVLCYSQTIVRLSAVARHRVAPHGRCGLSRRDQTYIDFNPFKLYTPHCIQFVTSS